MNGGAGSYDVFGGAQVATVTAIIATIVIKCLHMNMHIICIGVPVST